MMADHPVGRCRPEGVEPRWTPATRSARLPARAVRRRGGERRCPGASLPAHLPRAAEGPHARARRRQGGGAMAAAVEAHVAAAPLSGLVVTRYGHAAYAAASAHRGGRGGASGARRGRAGAPPRASWRWRRARPPTIWCCASISRRRLGAARAAGRGPDARRQAGDQPARCSRSRRRDRRDELRAQAPVGDQGRPARRALRAGAGRHAADLRRARRRPGGDRQRPDRARSDHLRRRARDPRALRDRDCRRGARRPRERRARDAEAGRSAASPATRCT